MRYPLLPFIDAVAYAESTPLLSTDIVAVWSFSGGEESLSRANVAEHLTSRLPYLADALGRRLENLPRHVERPYWVRTPIEMDEWVTHHDAAEAATWTDFIEALERISNNANRVDPTLQPWHLHVFYDVGSVPGCSSGATVVALHASHALITGLSMDPIAEALFGSDPRPVKLPGQPRALDNRVPWWAVLYIVATIPVNLVRFLVGVYRQRGQTMWTVTPDQTLAPRTVLNDGSGAKRVRMVRLDRSELNCPGLSMTNVALTALSLAVERYLDSSGAGVTENLYAALPVKVPDPKGIMGVNQITGARVNLGIGSTSIRARATAIAESQRAEIERALSPEMDQLRQTLVRQPWLHHRLGQWWYAKASAKASPNVLYSFALSSIDWGKTPLFLCGAAHEFAGVTRYVGGDTGLALALTRTGNAVGLTVVATENAIPDLDGFVSAVQSTIGEVVQELNSPEVPQLPK